MCFDYDTNKWNLVGIVSRTNDCDMNNPGLATRISKYISFIKSLTENGKLCHLRLHCCDGKLMQGYCLIPEILGTASILVFDSINKFIWIVVDIYEKCPFCPIRESVTHTSVPFH